jgi:hypothetical protein
MKPLLKLFRSSRGNAMVEFALLAPLLLAMTGGIVEFGRAFVVYDQVNRLATQYASAWADCNDTPLGYCGSTELPQLTDSYAIGNMFPLLQSQQITLQMFQIDMANTSEPTVVYAYPAGATLTVGQTSRALASLSAGQTGVLVTVSYQHSLQYFPALMTPLLGSHLNPSYTVVQLRAPTG